MTGLCNEKLEKQLTGQNQCAFQHPKPEATTYLEANKEIAHVLLKNEVHDPLYKTLKIIGETSLISKASIFKWNPENKIASRLKEWVNLYENGPSEDSYLKRPQTIQYFSTIGLVDLLKPLFHEEPLIVDNVHDYKFSRNTLDFLKQQNINSLILAPLYYNNSLKGFIKFDDGENERKWSPETVDFFSTAAINVSSHLSYQETETQLTQTRASEYLLRNETSYCIRESLSSTIGMVDLLEDTQLSVEQKRFVSVIKDSSTKLLEFARDIGHETKLYRK